MQKIIDKNNTVLIADNRIELINNSDLTINLTIKEFKINNNRDVELPMMILKVENGTLNEVYVS